MVSGDRDLSAAQLRLAVVAPAHSRRSPSVPHPGAGWVGANPEPAPRTDAPPTANHHPERR
jgi:hypothetical protein